jgi:hypothetical protein
MLLALESRSRINIFAKMRMHQSRPRPLLNTSGPNGSITSGACAMQTAPSNPTTNGKEKVFGATCLFKSAPSRSSGPFERAKTNGQVESSRARAVTSNMCNRPSWPMSRFKGDPLLSCREQHKSSEPVQTNCSVDIVTQVLEN